MGTKQTILYKNEKSDVDNIFQEDFYVIISVTLETDTETMGK